ncbi:hypothetical protein AB0878_47920 [Amycolatopsis sp. NPDC047767]|uniref:hypothetical protein n=1 Tax=Amycolatopsis sp. NPDC047767 TaxID=3156765 RepID=UPI003454DCC0
MITIAVPELRRYAPDALRMVGIPIGQADEVADMLVWTQAVTGAAVKFVQDNRARLNWRPQPRPRVVDENADEVVVDLRGGSLLEFGPRVFDFVQAETAAHGSRRVRARAVYGGIFLPYLVARAAERGVHLDVSFPETPQGDFEPRGELTIEATRVPATPGALQTDAYRSAVDRGIELSDADFTTVIGLFEMLRVPTSERSRTHAG